MAQEITFGYSLTVYKPSVMAQALNRAVAEQRITMTGTTLVYGTMSVATSATAVPMGQVTAPGWCWFHNLDPTNYLTIRNGSGGADLLQLLAGESFWCRLISTAAPYAVANTAACGLEYILLSA